MRLPADLARRLRRLVYDEADRTGRHPGAVSQETLQAAVSAYILTHEGQPNTTRDEGVDNG